MAVKKKQTHPSVAGIAALLASPGKIRGTTDASVQLINDLGLNNGEWCLDSKPELERVIELGEAYPLFVRVQACIKLYTMGYLPGAAGLHAKKNEDKKTYTFTLEEKRYVTCKQHGAILAVVQVGGRLAPIGPSHIRNKLNDAALAVYGRDGIELTTEQQEQVKVSAKDVRRALEYLEELGFCLRTTPADVPLAELKQTEEGRAALRRMSGDNKIRIYFRLRPLKTSTPLGRHLCLPSNVISMETKPLYRQILRLGLKLDPAAFESNPGLQATIRAELDEREKLLAERDDHLRQALVAAGAVPLESKKSAQVSTVSNPTHVRVPERPLQTARQHGEAVEPVPGPQRQLSTPKASGVGEGDRALVSQPRKVEEADALHQAIERAGAHADAAGVRKILAACRQHVPDATPEEAAYFVPEAIAKMRGTPIKSVVGYLLTALPQYFEGPPFKRWRVQQSEVAQATELDRQAPEAETVTRCEQCGGSGLVGSDWETIGEAIAAVKAGAQFCACQRGEITHGLVERHCGRKFSRSKAS